MSIILDGTTGVTTPGLSSSSNASVTGTLQVSTGAAVGGATPGAGGLAFPASAVAVANANTLDDYEEGTWTPSLGGNTTYGGQVGTYTKIGRLVYVFCKLEVTTLGTGGQTIAGLPFTVAGNNETSTSVAWNSLAISSVYLVFYANTTSLYHQHATAAAASLTDGASIFASGTAVKFCLVYSI